MIYISDQVHNHCIARCVNHYCSISFILRPSVLGSVTSCCPIRFQWGWVCTCHSSPPWWSGRCLRWSSAWWCCHPCGLESCQRTYIGLLAHLFMLSLLHARSHVCTLCTSVRYNGWHFACSAQSLKSQQRLFPNMTQLFKIMHRPCREQFDGGAIFFLNHITEGGMNLLYY